MKRGIHIDQFLLYKVLIFGSNHGKRLKLIRAGGINFRYKCIQHYMRLLFSVRNKKDISVVYDMSRLLLKCLPSNIMRRIVFIFLMTNQKAKIPELSFEKNGQKAFVYVGDSHSEFWSRIWERREKDNVIALHLGPILANTFANNYEKIEEIVQFLNSYRDLHSIKFLCIVLSLGEIDIRVHSYSQVMIHNNYETVEDYANTLAINYSKAIKKFKERVLEEDYRDLDIKIVIRRQTPPSADTFYTPNSKDDMMRILKKCKHPVVGPVAYRVNADKILWNTLKNECLSSGIYLQDLPEILYNNNGTLNEKYSEDLFHITNMDIISLVHGNLLKIVNA